MSERDRTSYSTRPNDSAPVWVFGYGSLIWKVDFPHLKRNLASIHGWERRFWQGSHDHRGVPNAPGRVVTLVPASKSVCTGVALLVEPKTFAHLDYREKNGYQRIETDILLFDQGNGKTGTSGSNPVRGTVYVADDQNFAYLGPASTLQIAAQVNASEGPSGTNREYVLELARALRNIGAVDRHVFELETAILAMDCH